MIILKKVAVMDAKLVHASIRNYLGYILLNMKDIGMQYAINCFQRGHDSSLPQTESQYLQDILVTMKYCMN